MFFSPHLSTKKICRQLAWVVLTTAGTCTIDETSTEESRAGSGSGDLGAPVTIYWTTQITPIRQGRAQDMFKWVSVTFEERSVWLRFAELSDRPISLVCRALVTARNKRRTRQSTLPRRKNSEFTAFRGGKDVCSHPSTRG